MYWPIDSSLKSSVSIHWIISPEELLIELPIDDKIISNIADWRITISSLIHGLDKRLLVIVGPCSIHDPVSAIEYASHVLRWREEFWNTLEIIMRTYWEKPRTTIGWKGFINDPYLDGTHDIEHGLRIARKLLLDIAHMWIPTATEFLDPIVSLYLSDLISWGAIGARTTESQIHRELASGLPCPIGFKNSTDGSIRIAVDAMQSASCSHTVISVQKTRNLAITSTSGNPNVHVILRWSTKGINYDKSSISEASEMAKKYNLPSRVMIDVSHQNSQKDYRKQIDGINTITEYIKNDDLSVLGVMIESHLLEWSQNYTPWKSTKEERSSFFIYSVIVFIPSICFR